MIMKTSSKEMKNRIEAGLAISTEEIYSKLKIYCQYCCDYLCCASETECGHIFCQECIEDYLIYLDECPICKQKLRKKRIYSNIFLDNIISDYIRVSDIQEHQRFQQRLKDRKYIKSWSKLDIFFCGLRLDVRDKQYVWSKGMVLDVLSQTNNENGSVLVRYEHSRQQEQIFFKEKRLAIYGTFTNRKQLPHYEGSKIIIEKHGTKFELVEWNKQENKQLENRRVGV